MNILLIIVVLFIIFYVIGAYNNGVRLKNYVKEAFATMDVYLKKRWDLIPNLIETVKGYAEHEKGLLEELTNLRTKNYSEMSNSEKFEKDSELSKVLSRFLAVSENYPDLKANQNFALLQDELSKIEEDIANSRKYYNGTVRELNTFLEVFPTNIIGSAFGIGSEELFEISETERENVKVSF